jgi:hypothetical protein
MEETEVMDALVLCQIGLTVPVVAEVVEVLFI